MIRKRLIGSIVALLMLCLMLPASAFAVDGEGDSSLTKRTILIYFSGTDLESNHGMASHNLRQILSSEFSEDDDVKVVVMTGGSNRWHLEESYLSFPDNGANLPDDAVVNDEGETLDPKSQISNCYNQIWEARGADAKLDDEPDPNAGKLVLLDGDGVKGSTPVRSEDELVTNPETLKTFINYGASKYPAEKYDLILWDHGGGPTGGFGGDDHAKFSGSMTISGIVDAIRDNAVTNRMDDDPDNDANFDFIDFDACLMNTIDLNLLMADYTDYYIASPEIEPGYGQDYRGWMNTVGAAPDTNAYELGKQMVDDYVTFYEKGLGKGQEGTLGVVDSKKFVDSGITSALSEMSSLLRQQSEDGLFYDEIHSSTEAIPYSSINFFDLGNFASLVSITNSEVSDEDLDGDGTLDPDNEYTQADITKNICGVLQDEDIVYARGTSGIRSRDKLYRTIGGSIESGDLSTSGMSFYFVSANNENSIENFTRYYDEMAKAIELMPDKEDGRYQFMKAHKDNLMNYAFIAATGRAVNRLINFQGKDKGTINYEIVKEYMKGGASTPEEEKYSDWGQSMKPLFDRCDGGESEARVAWLDKIVRQQAEEAVDRKNVTAGKVKQKGGTGYQIQISNTRNRVIENVERNIELENAAIDSYMREHGDFGDSHLSFGSVNGHLDISSALQPGSSLSDIIRWYNGKESEWVLDAPETKWYAIRDAEGHLHAVAIDSEDATSFKINAKSGDDENERRFTLKFEKGDGVSKLAEITDVTDDENNRPVRPSDLIEPVSMMPSLHVSGRSHGVIVNIFIPASDSGFTLSSDNVDDISLVYTDISEIPDIRDTDGDGNAFHSSFNIADIYGGMTDISDLVNGAEEELTDIALARVRPAIYTGKANTPEVVYGGEKLQDGTDYTWDLVSAEETDFSESGAYNLLLTGKGRFTGVDLKTFNVVLEEDAAATLVSQAQAEYNEAKSAMDEAVGSGDTDAIQTAYTRLINAQSSLTDAKAELERTRAALTAEEQAELEDRIEKLEKKIEDFTEELTEAKVVDISNYQTTMKTSFTYTGKAIEPAVEVSGLSPSVYKVDYSGNTAVGTAQVTITANDPLYKGTITRTFKIMPKKAAIAKVKSGKKKLTVKAKTAVSKTGGTSYQIQYRLKGTSKWKTKTTNKQTLTIKKLKKGKKYQLRIRALKKIGKDTYYGAWSSISNSKRIR